MSPHSLYHNRPLSTMALHSSTPSSTTSTSPSAPTTTSTAVSLSSSSSSQPFSLNRQPLLAHEMKKARNSKRLSLMVVPPPLFTQDDATNNHNHPNTINSDDDNNSSRMMTPTTTSHCSNNNNVNTCKTTTTIPSSSSSLSLPLIVTPSPSFPPMTNSLSSRRAFTPAPLSSNSLKVSAAPSTPMTSSFLQPMSSSFSSKRNSQLSLDEALPSPRFPKSISTPTLTSTPRTSNAPRTISAYFSDFSIECGAASPYVTEPVMVLPSLYLGAEHNATDLHTLKRLGITFVLNVAVEIAKEDNDSSNNSTTAAAVKQIDGLREGIEYQSLAWSHHQRNLLRDFPKAFRMIDEATTGSMNGGKVLVHCQLGVSRSASLVIACVMRSKGMGLSEAYDFVKQKSGVISPNMSLMYQLAEFEKDLARKKTTTTSPSSSSSPMSAGSRKSWESQMEEDEEDEPPYPFAAAFSEESSQSETSKNNLIVPTLRDTMVMPMEMSTTPIRQEFHMKRPLTPDENSRDEYPNNKPFLNAPRLAYPRLSSVPRSSSSSSLASRRWSVGHSPLSKVSTPPSSPPSSPQQHQRASMSLSPKTPTTEQFSTMSLSNDRNNHHDDDFLMMMIPETPSFLQTTFSIPPPLSSSCSSSSASSVSSFEACSRLTSLNSNATSSHCSFFTAGDDDEDEQAEEEEDSGPGSLFSPRNSWNLVPVPKSSGSTSASSLGQQQKKRRNLWSGLQTMQVLAEGAIPSTFMGHDDDQDGDDEVEMSESHHIEAIKSSPGSASGRQVAAPRRVTASGSAPRLTLPLPDFIFSPRPYNTPTVATATARSFEEVYEALFMEN